MGIQGIERKSLDIAVVVPSYREGQDIIHTLSSLARQEGVDGIRFAVFVVVNNARNATEEVLASNARTASLIEHIQRGEVPSDLEDRPFKFRGVDHSPILAFQRIIESALQVILVDLSSGENAPEECNVGVARDVGGKVASECLKDDGIMVMTDADTLLDEGYISGIEKFFRLNPDIEAATGIVETYRFHSERHLAPTQDIVHLHWQFTSILNEIFQQYIFRDTGERDENTVMPGANMAFRVKVFQEMGGIPHLAGGEDTAFSLALLKEGMNIRFFELLKVFTADRVSDRTDQACGWGQVILKTQRHGSDFSSFPESPVHSQIFLLALQTHIDMANSSRVDEAEWRRNISKGMLAEGYTLTPPQVDILWEENQRAPNVPCRLNHFLLKAIQKIAEEHVPKVPLQEAIAGARDFILERDEEIIRRFRESLDPIFEAYRELERFLVRTLDEALEANPGVLKIEDRRTVTEEELRYSLGLPIDEADSMNRRIQEEVDILSTFLYFRGILSNGERALSLGREILKGLGDSEENRNLREGVVFILNAIASLVNAMSPFLYARETKRLSDKLQFNPDSAREFRKSLTTPFREFIVSVLGVLTHNESVILASAVQYKDGIASILEEKTSLGEVKIRRFFSLVDCFAKLIGGVNEQLREMGVKISQTEE